MLSQSDESPKSDGLLSRSLGISKQPGLFSPTLRPCTLWTSYMFFPTSSSAAMLSLNKSGPFKTQASFWCFLWGVIFFFSIFHFWRD